MRIFRLHNTNSVRNKNDFFPRHSLPNDDHEFPCSELMMYHRRIAYLHFTVNPKHNMWKCMMEICVLVLSFDLGRCLTLCQRFHFPNTFLIIFYVLPTSAQYSILILNELASEQTRNVCNVSFFKCTCYDKNVTIVLIRNCPWHVSILRYQREKCNEKKTIKKTRPKDRIENTEKKTNESKEEEEEEERKKNENRV